ncbi:MAG: hypothetical protein JL50_05490 [Peptococcaceae bacterium BICA1-7]|nr:MAG: hypothetical protein JL50_05490 [Peptococcaceae bacterium BICA1-7]HBV96065.1 hypothetical protein [Desulfotomaculum sp.]
MLPHEEEKIKGRLMKAGYFRHRVDRMKPWTLLQCQGLENKKQKRDYLSEYLPYIEPSYVDTSILAKIIKEAVLVKTHKDNRSQW